MRADAFTWGPRAAPNSGPAGAVLALLLAALAVAGCGAGGPAAESSALSRRIEQGFPRQAAAILRAGAAPARGADGLSLHERVGALAVTLPERAEDPVILRLPGLEIRVREEGGAGRAAVVGSAIAYEASRRASLWLASPGGAEEWLLLPAGVAGEIASWAIEGARPIARAGGVALLDAKGAPRVAVSAPAAFGEGGAPLGARLEVRGSRVVLSIEEHEGEALVDPAWIAAGTMTTARMRHTATLLPGGKVLVTGGTGAGGELASVELYDPMLDAWTPAKSMTSARSWHQAELLQNGKVLVVGGVQQSSALASAELYDPAMDAWTPAASLTAGRFRFSTTVLANGKVLAVGGFAAGATLGSVELYDPAMDVWSPAASLGARGGHRAILQQDHSVLVSGGLFVGAGLTTTLADALAYDPVADAWTARASMTTARFDHSATLLPAGTILVAGGSQSDGFVQGTLASLELFDPALNGWTAAGALAAQRAEHVAAILGDGTVVFAGGDANGATADVFDPTTSGVSATSPMTQKRLFATGTALGSGKVLVAGGEAASVLASSELLGPLAAVGALCALPGDCLSGACVSGVCCGTPCTGACQACSKTAGSPKDGTCGSISGPACDDGNACTLGDICQSGSCAPGAEKACAPIDACHLAGPCDPKSGLCAPGPLAIDGAPCDDGNLCTTGETCTAGACGGGTQKKCGPAPDACHGANSCDPATGMCGPVSLSDGTPCDDGDACTKKDACTSGVCAGTSDPCLAIDDCKTTGTCDPTTGACVNPNKHDGAICGGGVCVGGVCQGPPSSSSSSGSSAGAGGGADTSDPGGGGGCGCAVTGQGGDASALASLALASILAERRRRRAARDCLEKKN